MPSLAKIRVLDVRRRIGGLEKRGKYDRQTTKVRRRIGGLEMIATVNTCGRYVRRRIGGLENARF